MCLCWFDGLLWPIVIEIHASCKTSDTHLLIGFYFAEELRVWRNRIHQVDFTFATGNEEHVSLDIVNHSLQTVRGTQILTKKELATFNFGVIEICNNKITTFRDRKHVVNSWVHRYPHDSHLHIVDRNFWQLFHYAKFLVFLAMVSVDKSWIETQIQNWLLITPMHYVSLRSIGFSPTCLRLPYLFYAIIWGLVVAFGDSVVLESSNSRYSLFS